MESSNTSPLSNLKMNNSPKSSVNDNQSAQMSSMSSNVAGIANEKLRKHLKSIRGLQQRGRIELIMGPMFAGKSTELLRRVNRLEISGKKCLSVKFAGDSRYSNDSISTHDKIQRMAVSCNQLKQLGEIWQDFEVIGIDEGQFFDDLVDFCQNAANKGKIVILSALNGMYTQKGFPVIQELIPLCETVKKLTSICKLCGSDASYTYRTVQGNNAEILIGGADSYMPLCRQCLDYMNNNDNSNNFETASKNQVLYSEPSDMNTTNGSSTASKNTPLLDLDQKKSFSPKQKGSSTPDKEIRKYNSDIEGALRNQM